MTAPAALNLRHTQKVTKPNLQSFARTMTIERRRHARSYFNSTKNWVVYDTGKSQLAVQPPPVPPPPPPLPPLASNDGSSSNSRSTVAYRDTARWGKDKMTYEELSVAWDAFNRAEELKAFYFAQSEVCVNSYFSSQIILKTVVPLQKAVDHLLEQVFQNVRIDCEDLDGLKPPPRPSPSSVSTSKRCKEGCGVSHNNSNIYFSLTNF